MRGPAENDVVRLLIDEILTDGFVTSGEPLLVTQSADLLSEIQEQVYSGSFWLMNEPFEDDCHDHSVLGRTR